MDLLQDSHRDNMNSNYEEGPPRKLSKTPHWNRQRLHKAPINCHWEFTNWRTAHIQFPHQMLTPHAHAIVIQILRACRSIAGEPIFADYNLEQDRLFVLLEASPGQFWLVGAQSTRLHLLTSPTPHVISPSLGAMPTTASLAQTLTKGMRIQLPRVPQNSPLPSPLHASTDQSILPASERKITRYQSHTQALPSSL